MKVNGKHEFKISREKLWSYLMDPEVLAKITPGVSKLEVTGEDQFKTISDIKIGPVKGSFKGKLNVVEKTEPESFVINMEQHSKIGNAHVKVDMKIDETENGNAALIFDGNAKLSGMIARTGQRVLSGVANVITKEVFEALEKHIEENEATTATESKVVEKNEKVESTPLHSKEKRQEKIVEDKLVERDNTIVETNSVKEKVIETVTMPEKEKVTSTNAATTANESGLLNSIANFFKSIFGSK